MAGEDTPGAAEYGRAWSAPGLREETRTFFRLSPAERAARCGCFAVRRGAITVRLDPFYNRPEHFALVRAINAGLYGAMPIGNPSGDVAKDIIEGRITPKRDSYSDDPSHPVFLRAQNIEEGFLRFDQAKRLLPAAFAEEPKAILEDGDLVLTIDGVLLGIAAVHRPGDLPCCVSNHMVRIQHGRRIDPDFLAAFLNGPSGQGQIKRGITGSAIPGLRADAIERIVVPTPPLAKQRELLGALDAARAARRRKLEEAESLLGGLDAIVLDALGLTLPPADGRTVYAVRLRDIQRGRFDPHFFRPEYLELARRFAKVPHRPLGKLVRLSREIWSATDSDAPTFRYIEISGVNTTTGEATGVETPVAEAPSRARMQVRRGDVIVSLTRPHHGAIGAIDDELDGCIASTGFAVLRDSLIDNLDHSYLWTVLRCQTSLMQMQQRSSGGNYPAITEDELQRVLIPVPDDATQKKIAAEVSRRRDAARRLRHAAARLWDDAKRRFEEELLGPAPAPAKAGKQP